MVTTHEPAAPGLSPDSATGSVKPPLIPMRYFVVSMLFLMTTINNADRATLGAVKTSLSKELRLDSGQMGIVLSAIGWSYVAAQLPGGWLLDRFGSYGVYTWCIVLWSTFTLLQGFVGVFHAGVAIALLFILRLLVGLAEAPSFPANGRIVANWFPTKERGTASAIFNSAQYFATVLFTPLMGTITYYFGWRFVFGVMGAFGLAIVYPWLKIVRPPMDHPRLTPAERTMMEEGGALVSMDQAAVARTASPFRWTAVKELLNSRMMIGIYMGQYCINTLTTFFLTWFLPYLVEQRHMTILTAGFVAVLPALCGFAGGILGGVFSDFLLRRGFSLTVARKFPIVAGMLLSCVLVACNYVSTDWVVVLFMSAAFFGKGVGALGWTVVSDTAPKELMGTCGALFNMFGNLSTITTPIAIGYIVLFTGGFNGALIFVSAHAVGAMLSYLLVVGKIQRLELSPGAAGFPVVTP